MGEPSKKTAPKAEVVAPEVPAEPLKKRKREASEVIEKEVRKKKQKNDVEQVIEKEITKKKQKKDVAAKEATVKKVKVKTEKDTGVEAKAKTPLTPQPQTLGSKTLLVEGLSYNTKKADVENFFKECGGVVDVGIATWPNGAPKRYAHVKFATVEALQKAKEEKDGKDLVGRAVRLEIANKSWTCNASSNKENLMICVEGLNEGVEGNKMKDALRKHFSSCGEVTKIAVPTHRLKGYAYIEFKSKDAVESALKFDLSELNTCPLKVKEAQPRDDSGQRFHRVVRFEGKKTIFGDD